MSTTDVTYNATVIVEVDDETGEILRVNVDDENVELDPSEDPNAPAVKATQDPDNFWPAWEFGF